MDLRLSKHRAATAGERSARIAQAPGLDGYELRGELGRGGMGVVYRAYDEAARREVALKVLAKRSGARSARFKREGEVAARLNHPGVLKVSNIQEEGRNIGYADAVTAWHTDMSYTSTPPRCTMLYAIEVPHDEAGAPLGDTLFASAVDAYDALPEATKQRIAGLKAVHRFSAKKRGVIAVARKLSVLLHRLWLTGEVYEPFHSATQSKKVS